MVRVNRHYKYDFCYIKNGNLYCYDICNISYVRRYEIKGLSSVEKQVKDLTKSELDYLATQEEKYFIVSTRKGLTVRYHENQNCDIELDGDDYIDVTALYKVV